MGRQQTQHLVTSCPSAQCVSWKPRQFGTGVSVIIESCTLVPQSREQHQQTWDTVESLMLRCILGDLNVLLSMSKLLCLLLKPLWCTVHSCLCKVCYFFYKIITGLWLGLISNILDWRRRAKNYRKKTNKWNYNYTKWKKYTSFNNDFKYQ